MWAQEGVGSGASPAAGTMSDEVTDFLAKGRLEEFAPALLTLGWDSIDRLALMNDRDMMLVGLEMRHRRQLQKMLAERSAHCLAEPLRFPLRGWEPYGMAPFCPGPWVQPPWSQPGPYGVTLFCPGPWVQPPWSQPGPYGVTLFCPGPWVQPPWSQPLPASWGPPGVLGEQRPSEPIKVLSPSVEEFADVGTLFVLCLVRLLQDTGIVYLVHILYIVCTVYLYSICSIYSNYSMYSIYIYIDIVYIVYTIYTTSIRLHRSPRGDGDFQRPR